MPNPGRSEYMRARWSEPAFALRQRANLARGRSLRWSPRGAMATSRGMGSDRQTVATSPRTSQVVDRPPSVIARPAPRVVSSPAAAINQHPTTRRDGSATALKAAGVVTIAGLIALIAARVRQSSGSRADISSDRDASTVGRAEDLRRPSWSPPEYRW